LNDPQRIDPERLAALLDGKLSEHEAASVRAELASAGDDSIAAYADAVAIAAEMGTGATPVIELHQRRRFRWQIPATLAAAAVALIVVNNRLSSSRSYAPAQFALALSASSNATIEPAWSVTRGADDQIASGVQAVRLGALLTDLEVTSARGDTAAVRAQTAALARVLESLPGGAPIASSYEAIATRAGAAIPTSTERRDLGKSALDLVSPSDAAMGSVAEAIRIAALARDEAALTKLVSSAKDLRGESAARVPAASQAADSLVSLLNARPHAPDLIRDAATNLLRLVAS
jgi:hypothetical protein